MPHLTTAVSESCAGELTDGGRLEHRGTAKRVWQRHHETLGPSLASGRPVVFEATDKARTKGSRDAFLSGFLESLHEWRARNESAALLLEKAHGHGKQGEQPNPFHYTSVVHDFTADGHTGLVVVEPPACNGGVQYGGDDHLYAYAKMRFFDVCPAYTRYKAEKPWMGKLAAYVANASRPESRETSFLRQVFTEDTLRTYAALSTSAFKKLVKKLQRARAAASAIPGVDDDADEAPMTELEIWRKTRASPSSAVKVKKMEGPGQSARAARKASGKGGDGEEEGRQPEVDIPLLAQLTADMYTVCQIEMNALGRSDRFCALFSESTGGGTGPAASAPSLARQAAGGKNKGPNGSGKGKASAAASPPSTHLELMAKNELIRDLGDYYKQGAGEPIANAASCLLLEDFIESGDEGAGLPRSAGLSTAAGRASRRASTQVATFRFGHSETVMPLLSMLGLYQEPTAPSLEDYYHAELTRGTKQLLNSTRYRLDAILNMHALDGASNETSSSTSGATTSEEAEVEAANGYALPHAVEVNEGKKGCSGSDKKSCKGSRKSRALTSSSDEDAELSAEFTSIPSSQDRSLPQGFNEPLLLALKHPWSGARLVPMAANVQIELYDCGDPEEGVHKMYGMWARMLHNEREVGFPACGVYGPSAHGRTEEEREVDAMLMELKRPENPYAAPFGMAYACPWERVKSFYRGAVYSRYGLTSCSVREWEQFCGGVGSCKSDGSS